MGKNEDDGEKQSMKNTPPSLGSPTDASATQIEHTEKREGEALIQVKTEMNRSKLVGKRRRNVQTKKIFKKLRKVEKMAAKAADTRAETNSMRAEMDELDAAAEEKMEEVKSLKEKRDGGLAKILLMSVTEQVLMEILFP